MGRLAHNAIIVTGWKPEKVKEAREKAIYVFSNHFNTGHSDGGIQLVSPIIHSVVNGQSSFFVAPDGSKEGREDSNEGDKARKEFLEWLKVSNNRCDYIEVLFGGDEIQASIVTSNHSDEH